MLPGGKAVEGLDKDHPMFWTEARADHHFPLQFVSSKEIPIDEFLNGLEPRWPSNCASVEEIIRQFCPVETDSSLMEDRFKRFRDWKASWYDDLQSHCEARDNLSSQLCTAWLVVFNRLRGRLVGMQDRPWSVQSTT